jgi:hypothetical protein
MIKEQVAKTSARKSRAFKGFCWLRLINSEIKFLSIFSPLGDVGKIVHPIAVSF